MIAVVGLTAAVVILATNDDRDSGAGSATQVSAPGPAGSTRYDGGPEDGSRGVVPAQPPSTRYDGGPTRAPAARCLPARPRTRCPAPATTATRGRHQGSGR